MNEEMIKKARSFLKDFKGDCYIFGMDCLKNIGNLAKKLGIKALLIISKKEWAKELRHNILNYLNNANIDILKIIDSTRPNAPMEDVYRLQDEIVYLKPEMIIVVGGGSTIDAAKAASILSTYSPDKHDIEPFFGIDKVTDIKKKTGKIITPVLAVQVTASSGSHLTKYSNVTNVKANQKKLIIDDEIIPKFAIFDYDITKSMGKSLTADGALDGIAHCLEVYYGISESNININKIKEISLLGIKMIVDTLPKSLEKLKNSKYREILGLGTDLGGYALMLGGTNGAHLTSFSLIDILSHGRACAILNPYYTVFFAPAIRKHLEELVKIYHKYINKDININIINSRELGEIVAKGMINFSREIGFPVRLSEVKGFNNTHIDNAISAAKNPQLEMKLKSMPIPLKASQIEEYMRPILEAANTGDISIIKNLSE